MRRGIALLVTTSFILAGCIDSKDDLDESGADSGPSEVLGDRINLTIVENMMFTERVVDAAVGFTNDLYEPTMDVSDSGVIYVTGHTILVDTTGAPAFFSRDDGDSWAQLPFFQDHTMPEPIHGATPPPSDEMFFAAGDDGWVYGVDITAATFPVNAWSGDGAEHAYHNPNAYDRVQSTSAGPCSAASLNDRPWAAYGDGKLLMVNNPGGGPMQIGVLDVPPSDALGIGGPMVGPEWNTCASTGGYIPGIADMRDDHFFAVPQTEDGALHVVTGNAEDIFDVQQRHVFNVTNSGGGTSNYGQVVFDAHGTMFVGIRNNTAPDDDDSVTGQLKIAVSQDDGETFNNRTIDVGSATRSLYMDGNMAGPGALLTWAQVGESGTDWYSAHLFVGPDGGPVVENVNLVVKDGPPPSAHVQGAASGPDGRSYMVMFHGGYTPVDQATPIHIWVQEDGETLPVDLKTPSVAIEEMAG